MDIKYIRENPEKVKENQLHRFKDPSIVDSILEIDKTWREIRSLSDNLRRLKNKLSMSFKDAPTEESIHFGTNEYPTSQLVDKLMDGTISPTILTKDQLKVVSKYTTQLNSTTENEADKRLVERDALIADLGNYLYKESPVDNNEENNPVIFQVSNNLNTNYPKESAKDHIELLERLGFVDTTTGIKIAGNRGYFLTGMGVRLNQALISYGLDFLEKKEYVALETPHFMNSETMGKIAQLSDYQETLYKLDGYDKYLIATSEQPLTAYFEKKVINSKQLPIKLCGLSSCYRKEAGAHAHYTRGIYRVHQFQKLEQFCVTKPEESWDMFNKMINISKDFYQSLGLSFRIINIVSGALNNSAAMKYDLEAYYPASNTYCELVSCTNVLDYFSKRINTKDQKGNYLHMLNCTLCANTRTICALVETYQTTDGFIVPKVLRPYMGGKEFIPFRKD